MAKIRIKNIGKVIAWLMRAIASTIRYEVYDEGGGAVARQGGCVWSFWHNRMFLIPYIHHHWFPWVKGAILTSPSGDGQIIADVCASFGFEAARGSSSKPQKGLSALMMLAERVRAGFTVGITPDGPRGPKYQLQPGIIKLAQLTGCPVVPVHVVYTRVLRFRTWDEFMLPLPFSRVKVILGAPLQVPRRMTEEEIEQHRSALEQSMSRHA